MEYRLENDPRILQRIATARPRLRAGKCAHEFFSGLVDGLGTRGFHRAHRRRATALVVAFDPLHTGAWPAAGSRRLAQVARPGRRDHTHHAHLQLAVQPGAFSCQHGGAHGVPQ